MSEQLTGLSCTSRSKSSARTAPECMPDDRIELQLLLSLRTTIATAITYILHLTTVSSFAIASIEVIPILP